MNKIILKVVVTLMLVLVLVVNVLGIDINTCQKVKNTVEDYSIYCGAFHTYSDLESGYDIKVEKIISDKLIKSESKVYIFDIDETCLNNYIGEFILKAKGINIYNKVWIKKDRLTLGLKHPELVVKKYIKEAINQLIKDGKHVYFVTNTEYIYEKEVTETISKLLEIESPQIIFRSKYPGMENNMKYKRFQQIAEKENVSIDDIIFIGDDIRDFPNTKIDNFGVKYFLISQKMYGMQEIYSEKYEKYIEKEVK